MWTRVFRQIIDLQTDELSSSALQKVMLNLNNSSEYTKYISLLNSVLLCQFEGKSN